MQPASARSSTFRPTSWPILGCLVLAPATVGWLVGVLWVHWPFVSDMWYEASVQRYLTMTGQVGPVTYLVTHDDFDALQASVASLDGVLGIEVHRHPDRAAIAFQDAGIEAIETVHELPTVSSMQQAYIPMICH